MSSTNRGGQREPTDFYQTPAWCTDALLRHVGPLAGKRILEPSAGEGAIVKRLLAHGALPDHVTAIEPNRQRQIAPRDLGPINLFDCHFEEWIPGDDRFDIAILNPPFSLAEEHIRLAISLLAPGGLCCALERLSFGSSAKRAPFRAAHQYDKLELASRPSFTKEMLARMTEEDLLAARIGKEQTAADVRKRLKQTDSADYAWFAFGTWPDGATVWPGTRCGGRFMVLEDSAS